MELERIGKEAAPTSAPRAADGGAQTATEPWRAP